MWVSTLTHQVVLDSLQQLPGFVRLCLQRSSVAADLLLQDSGLILGVLSQLSDITDLKQEDQLDAFPNLIRRLNCRRNVLICRFPSAVQINNISDSAGTPAEPAAVKVTSPSVSFSFW